jgi:hypothetical protein
LQWMESTVNKTSEAAERSSSLSNALSFSIVLPCISFHQCSHSFHRNVSGNL